MLMRKHGERLTHHARRIATRIRNHRLVNRHAFINALLFVNLIFLLLITANTLCFPNTFVGDTNLGLKPKSYVQSFISRIYTTPMKVTINAHTYDLTYEHMGVYVNPNEITKTIFTPNTQPFPFNIISFFTSFFYTKKPIIPLSFSQEFYDYVDKIDAEGAQRTDIVYIDQNNKQASLFTPEQPYRVNTQQFQDELTRHFGLSDTPLTIPLVEVKSTILQQKVESANTKLSTAYAKSLTVIVGINQSNQFLTLSPSDLKRYTLAHISTDTGDIQLDIHKEAFYPDLSKALTVYASNFNAPLAYDQIGKGVRDAIKRRFDGEPADSVKVGIDSGANTDGEVAKKYIEIDISQQRMFTFRDKKLVKTYRVSTGKDYPTPIGTFQILNKAGIGYSSIYHVWMPYWMAFSFSSELHAYFGIHELPYFYSGGNKIQRPRDFIGAPNTGGCVALDIGDAKEVYQFADIGTPVVIYQ